jgi:hypothetical protein
MSLPDQIEVAALRLTSLDRFRFLCRPALREGEVSQVVFPVSIDSIVRDSETGEYCFPDHELVERVRSRLAARGGIPAATILKEQEIRLTRDTHQHAPPQTRAPLQPAGTPVADGNGRQPSQLPAGTQPEPRSGREPQSRPTLDAQQQAFLTFLITNPDAPIAAVSKGLGVRAETGAKIRDTLKAQGLLGEVEVRTGRTGAGRRMKILIPTMQAFELLGKEPPAGRGGTMHRHLQQLIAAGATAKGYTAQCEKELGTGAIVDVHLERGGEKVAVEIAAMSHPSRELAHIRQCLDAGYNKVFVVFADSQLLERTREALGVVFADAELSRVQLMPISKLACWCRVRRDWCWLNNLFPGFLLQMTGE